MVRNIAAREDLPDLENALEVLVLSNVYNGTFVREKELYNGMPVFSHSCCGGWELLFVDTFGAWTLKTRRNNRWGPPRTCDKDTNLWIFDKGGENEHVVNTTVEVTRFAGEVDSLTVKQTLTPSKDSQDRVMLSKEDWELYETYAKELTEKTIKLEQFEKENIALKNEILSVVNENTTLKVRYQQVKEAAKQLEGVLEA